MEWSWLACLWWSVLEKKGAHKEWMNEMPLTGCSGPVANPRYWNTCLMTKASWHFPPMRDQPVWSKREWSQGAKMVTVHFLYNHKLLNSCTYVLYLRRSWTATWTYSKSYMTWEGAEQLHELTQSSTWMETITNVPIVHEGTVGLLVKEQK